MIDLRDAGYGKTNRTLELHDLEWWVQHVVDINPRLPVFLMGHACVSSLFRLDAAEG